MITQKLTEFLLGPVATSWRSQPVGSWKSVKPVYNADECTSCGHCEMYCPTGVVLLNRNSDADSITFNYEYCKGCGICSEVCQHRCIAMVNCDEEN